jgi:hypothetical protein
MIQSYINNLIVSNNTNTRPAPSTPPRTQQNYAFKFGEKPSNNAFQMFGFGSNPASTDLQHAFRTII